MARQPKLFIKGTLIEVSSRVEEGLPFTPNELNSYIIGSIIARAQTLYPVTIVDYTFMPNHFHMLLVVNDSKNISNFIGYFKRESAHAINRMLGRRQRTVWSERFDSPVILDSEAAIRRINYIYLNPVQAGLISEAKLWPLSTASWIDFNKTANTKKFKPIPRNKIPYIPETPPSPKEVNKLCKKLMDLPGEYFTLTIEPNAWKKCFKDTITMSDEELNKIIFHTMKRKEEELKLKKEKEGSSYPSLESLKYQNIRTPYSPKKFGNKMLCLATEKLKRISYLEWIKEYCKKLPRFSNIDLKKSLHYPPGFFAPGGFLSANLLPEHTPIAFLT